MAGKVYFKLALKQWQQQQRLITLPDSKIRAENCQEQISPGWGEGGLHEIKDCLSKKQLIQLERETGWFSFIEIFCFIRFV